MQEQTSGVSTIWGNTIPTWTIEGYKAHTCIYMTILTYNWELYSMHTCTYTHNWELHCTIYVRIWSSYSMYIPIQGYTITGNLELYSSNLELCVHTSNIYHLQYKAKEAREGKQLTQHICSTWTRKNITIYMFMYMYVYTCGYPSMAFTTKLVNSITKTNAEDKCVRLSIALSTPHVSLNQ